MVDFYIGLAAARAAHIKTTTTVLMAHSAVRESTDFGRNRPSWWVFLIALVPAVVICAVIGLQPFIDPADLFRDPLTVAHEAAAIGECCHAYYGAVSQLGGLIWAGGALIALFAASVMLAHGASRTAWQFMAAIGLLTGLLVVDDVFQGHEFVYPTLFGIPEAATAGVYAALMLAILWVFRRLIIETGPDLLIIALIAFAVGVVTDLFVSDQVSWHRLAEDGSKLIGITSWTTYLWWAAWMLMIERPRSAAD